MRPDGFEISGFDELAVKKVFGTTIKKISMYGFSSLVKSISEEEIDEDMKNQEILFDIKKDDKKESRGLSRIYLALKKVNKKKINLTILMLRIAGQSSEMMIRFHCVLQMEDLMMKDNGFM